MKVKAFPYTTDPEQIPAIKVVAVCDEDGPTVRYACPHECWTEHMDAWRWERRKGNKTAPEPMVPGHCMFETPEAYACIRYGDTSADSRRKAIESYVRGMLHGWDRLLYDAMPAALAKQKHEAIVKATVDAKMQGQDTGAVPFLACAWVGATA
jgi:hypothetical protein